MTEKVRYPAGTQYYSVDMKLKFFLKMNGNLGPLRPGLKTFLISRECEILQENCTVFVSEKGEDGKNRTSEKKVTFVRIGTIVRAILTG